MSDNMKEEIEEEGEEGSYYGDDPELAAIDADLAEADPYSSEWYERGDE